MACNPEVLKHVPLFALLDEEEAAVLAGQVELRTFVSRQRIYKIGDAAGQAYILVSGAVRVTTVDDDQQEVLVDQPAVGEFFGFASMIDETPHQTSAVAVEDTVCVEVDRKDISILLQRKPLAGMDLLAVLGRQFHAAQQLVRIRANRNPNELIEEEATVGERLADSVARFGGSWAFITAFIVVLVIYTAINIALRSSAWDPYPFILLNLFLSMSPSLSPRILSLRAKP
jgi:CRP-like cAMP-binding protein